MRLLAATLLCLTALTTHTAQAAQAADGLPGALSAYAGKTVYLDFWASWCGPCGESFPWLNAMKAKYGEDLVIVGVNVDTEAAAAEAFLKKHPATFDIVRDPEGVLPERYAIEGMPGSVILDPQGKVLHRHSGFRREAAAEYEAAIRAVLPLKEARQ